MSFQSQFVCLLFVVAFLTPPDAQATEGAALLKDKAVAVIRGQQVYNRACIACHGVVGDGNGPAAKYLNPRPRDFTSGTYKFRSTPSGELPTDEDLYRTVTIGIPRTMMPAWRDLLTEQERRDVVAYIKTFSNKFRQMGPGTPIQISREPKMSLQTIAEGKKLYMIMECWACHGLSGKGDGKSANTLKDDWGYKIKPFNFTLGNYKGGKDNRSIYKTFNTGLNGTPMPSYAETFLFGGDSIGDLSSYRE
ncbi:MAG: c-type cytochrome, partial [bacterium]